MSQQEDGFVHVSSIDELEREGMKLVHHEGQAIGLFYHEGSVYALDNRCPHMGFPLTRGTIDDGILTCHWHHARFELSCGSTFDPFADDVPSYPVDIRDGSVWIRPEPTNDRDPVTRWSSRLRDGLEENLSLVLAKSVIGLLDANADIEIPLEIATDFGIQYREGGWGSGLTILTAMANLLPTVTDEDRARALYTGVRFVSNDCAGEPPRFVQDRFAAQDVSPDRLASWFTECVEVRDTDGAERVLRTAIAADIDRDAIASMLLTAATDHRYLDAGHTIDFLNKSFELLELIGWDHADAVLPSLVPAMTDANRSEELSSWRQPVDLVSILENAFERLPELIHDDEWMDSWSPSERFIESLLADDPKIVVGTVLDGIESGVHPRDIAGAVADAAAMRIVHFSTANEFRDWNTVHHTYTYSNAVQSLGSICDPLPIAKAVLDGAINVYLDRFLNVPPAPEPSARDSSLTSDDLLDELRETFDEEGSDSVRQAGTTVAEYLTIAGDIDRLRETLSHAMLREDSNFHTLQNLEAAFNQLDRHGSIDTGRVHLLATTRYLAAHTPTRRQREQTFTIASRLHRGERLHEAAE